MIGMASGAHAEADERARARLRAAIAAAASGRLGSARRAALAALAEGASDPRIELAAASVLFVTRDYQRALDAAARAASADPRYWRAAIELRLGFSESLGWDQEARELLEEAAAREPDEARWPAQLTRLMVRAGAIEEALAWASRALAIEDRSPRMRMEVANLLAQVGDFDEAERMVGRALELAPAGELRYELGAARILADAGRVAGSRAALRRALAIDPAQPEVHVELAELALWEGDAAEALAEAGAAEALDPEMPATLRIRGAVAALAGEHREAAELLDRALAGDPDDYLTLTWRAEVALRLGDHELTPELLARSTMRAPGFHLAAWVIRFLSVAASDPKVSSGDRLYHTETAELRDAVTEMIPEAAPSFAGGRRGAMVEVLERALVMMAGNRSVQTTFRGADGQLQRLRVRGGVRFASRQALRRIRGLPPATVLAALDEVVRRYPRSALPICHRGELRFWIGDLEGARRDLDAAIERNAHTRWAYIGLTGIDILEGNPGRALQTSAHGVAVMYGSEGPAVFVYRGEARRLLGHFAAARRDLERAVEISEQRLGAWLNLALVYLALGDRPAWERAWERLRERASGLLSDAAHELGVVLWGDPREAVGDDERSRVLERALAMTRGNRSTGLTTYFTREGRLRFVQPSGGGGELPHTDDRRLLARARYHMTFEPGDPRPRSSRTPRAPRSAGTGSAPEPDPEPPPWRPRTLDAAAIDAFVRDGYLRLRGAFSRELAAAWVADANRRIREEPERWVRGYDVGDPERDLRGYDPADPATWSWPVIYLDGAHRLPYRELSPRLWGAICDLVGGPERVASEFFADDFVVSLRPFGARSDPFPGKGDRAWHVDNASRRARLDAYTNGLVLVALFSDLAPASGGTWLALDSIAKVARLLADAPEGVDLVERERVAALTLECERFLEVTGEVGDVFLLHPFMLHAGTVNPSGRIRWMSNPNIELRGPLRLDHRDPSRASPVERAILAGLPRG